MPAKKRLLPSGLIGPGRGMAIPSLVGIPPRLISTGNLQMGYRYAHAMVKAGILQPELWGGYLHAFLEEGLEWWLENLNFQALSDTPFVSLHVSMRQRPETARGALEETDDSAGAAVLLQVEVRDYMGLLAVKKTVAMFEELHQGAGVAFYWRFVDAIERWWPIWDFRSAAQQMENEGENREADIEYELAAAKTEGREPDLAQFKGERSIKDLPASLLIRPKRMMSISDLQVAAKAGNTQHQDMVALLADVIAASHRSPRPRYSKGQYVWDLYQDEDYAVPIFGVIQHLGDISAGLIDEYLQYAGETEHTPAFFWPITEPTPKAVAHGFRLLETAIRTIVAAKKLFDALPDSADLKGINDDE